MGRSNFVKRKMLLAPAVLALLTSGFALGQSAPPASACQQSNEEIAREIAKSQFEVNSCLWRLEVMPSSCGEGFEEQPIALACVTKLRDANPSSSLTARAFNLLDANRSILRARVIWAKAEADIATYRASGATDVHTMASRIRDAARADITKLPR